MARGIKAHWRIGDLVFINGYNTAIVYADPDRNSYWTPGEGGRWWHFSPPCMDRPTRVFRRISRDVSELAFTLDPGFDPSLAGVICDAG